MPPRERENSFVALGSEAAARALAAREACSQHVLTRLILPAVYACPKD